MSTTILPGELVRDWGVRASRILGRFRSKKNEVHRVGLSLADGSECVVVIKRFRAAGACRREAELLRGLAARGVRVPHMHHRTECAIIMQYIRGPLLLRALFAPGAREQIAALGEALEELYAGLADIDSDLILRDMNLRNFILSRRRGIYRVDLESAGPGRVEEDVGRLCAFCLTYDPPFTSRKLHLTETLFYSLVRRLRLRAKAVRSAALDELAAIEHRRDMRVPSRIRSTVRNW